MSFTISFITEIFCNDFSIKNVKVKKDSYFLQLNCINLQLILTNLLLVTAAVSTRLQCVVSSKNC